MSDRKVAVIGGIRTPFVKAGQLFRNFTSLDLGIHAVDSLISQLQKDNGLSPDEIEEIVYGTVLLDPRNSNAAREVGLRSRHRALRNVPAHFVSNNCITGLVALNWIFEGISTGRINSGIAAGAESMSTPALTLDPRGDQAWTRLGFSRTKWQLVKSLGALLRNPKRNFVPQAPSPKEPSTGLTMGEHCELMAKEWGISRESQDEWAFNSHQKAWNNYAKVSEEIADFNGVNRDNIVRPKTSVERLARLKPVFDKKDGTITAGTSSPLTDGASAVYLANADNSESKAWGYISDIEFSAIDPDDGLLMAPTLAVARLMKRNNLGVEDVDVFEIHEAFAAQVLSNLHVWKHGWGKHPEVAYVGEIPEEKINPHGGSISLGHPFAATGGRLVTSLVNQFRRGTATNGIISVCAGGAMGCAIYMTKD